MLFQTPRRRFEWRPRPNQVSHAAVDRFVRLTYLRHAALVCLGMVMGMRLSGALFFEGEQYLVTRERLEEEYWKEHGVPKHFAPDMVPCVAPDRRGQLCPTWIKISTESERYFRKVDPAEFIFEDSGAPPLNK